MFSTMETLLNKKALRRLQIVKGQLAGLEKMIRGEKSVFDVLEERYVKGEIDKKRI